MTWRALVDGLAYEMLGITSFDSYLGNPTVQYQHKKGVGEHIMFHGSSTRIWLTMSAFQLYILLGRSLIS
jgi:hypothetical protein